VTLRRISLTSILAIALTLSPIRAPQLRAGFPLRHASRDNAAQRAPPLPDGSKDLPAWRPAQPQLTTTAAVSLGFIENRGQFDPKVRFQFTNGKKALWLRSTGIVFDVIRGKEASPTAEGDERMVSAECGETTQILRSFALLGTHPSLWRRFGAPRLPDWLKH
jgi:hypothetical protein